MKRQDPKRIELSGPQSGLNAAFAGLEIAGLPAGEEPRVEAKSPSPAAQPRKAGRVVLRRETSHRGGKPVLIVHDFAGHWTTDALEELARDLRKACGCGGTLRDREIELQGENVTKLRAQLEARGFQVAGVR